MLIQFKPNGNFFQKFIPYMSNLFHAITFSRNQVFLISRLWINFSLKVSEKHMEICGVNLLFKKNWARKAETEKILQRYYLNWIFFSMKITQKSREWLNNLYGTGKWPTWKQIPTTVVECQGNIEGHGRNTWAVLSLTFRSPPWKGYSTKDKIFSFHHR